MLFNGRNPQLNLQGLHLKICDQVIAQVGSECKEKYFKFVGHVLDDKLSWTGHVEHICKKLASANYAINSSKNFLPLKIRKMIYYSLFDSHLNFGNLLWGSANQKMLGKVENLQKKCIRNVALKKCTAHTEPIYKNLEILKLSDKIAMCRSIFMHKYRHNKLPISFSDIFVDIVSTDELQTRHNDYNYLNKPAVKKYLEQFPYKKIVNDWNHLSIDLKSTADETEFQQLLKDKYFSNYSNDIQYFGPCYSCGTQ